MERQEAQTQLSLLRTALMEMVKRDPDQEVRDIAIPVVDEVLTSAKTFPPANHPIVARIQGVVTPERLHSEEPLMAADVLHVVNALYAAVWSAPRPRVRGAWVSG